VGVGKAILHPKPDQRPEVGMTEPRSDVSAPTPGPRSRTPTNGDIAATLNAIGDLLEIKGENRFRVNAYRDAARHVESLMEEMSAGAADGRLRSIPGAGQAIATKIQE